MQHSERALIFPPCPRRTVTLRSYKVRISYKLGDDKSNSTKTVKASAQHQEAFSDTKEDFSQHWSEKPDCRERAQEMNIKAPKEFTMPPLHEPLREDEESMMAT